MTIKFHDEVNQDSYLEIAMNENELTFIISEDNADSVGVVILTENSIDEFIEVLTHLRNKSLSFE